MGGFGSGAPMLCVGSTWNQSRGNFALSRIRNGLLVGAGNTGDGRARVRGAADQAPQTRRRRRFAGGYQRR